MAIENVKEERFENSLSQLSQFPDRSARSDNGKKAAEWLRDEVRCTPLHGFDGALAERDGCEAGRRADAFLRAAIGRIDTPLVDLDLDAAERRDRVEQDFDAMRSRETDHVLHRLEHARGSLRVHERDELVVARDICLV